MARCPGELAKCAVTCARSADRGKPIGVYTHYSTVWRPPLNIRGTVPSSKTGATVCTQNEPVVMENPSPFIAPWQGEQDPGISPGSTIPGKYLGQGGPPYSPIKAGHVKEYNCPGPGKLGNSRRLTEHFLGHYAKKLRAPGKNLATPPSD